MITASASTPPGAQLDTTLSATAVCPTGTVVLGGGAQATNSDTTPHPARVQVVGSIPVGGNSWQATGSVDVGLGASNFMTVTAFAVCSA